MKGRVVLPMAGRTGELGRKREAGKKLGKERNAGKKQIGARKD